MHISVFFSVCAFGSLLLYIIMGNVQLLPAASVNQIWTSNLIYIHINYEYLPNKIEKLGNRGLL